ncbi:P-type DNA transfer ATPase VirB11 [Pseudomonas sp. DCB_CB]|uniref:P-type DNA transfer ATPase VirB11 n=1 Tax=unclassified Pseudomonas TaxID=196821 RepID=UPI002248F13B|nr:MULTISPECIES: P-type DNA transfer ATPase VirB11 [unclassified Pseudomonas]MCX2694498.1 P-type DNA transfer ATPase VirB11 [Pseudomonas sp. DCB_BZ]MCX2859672.1 P-type DNA transfer ATPase VirB11 [Pseudomonas sp. DCB_CB]
MQMQNVSMLEHRLVELRSYFDAQDLTELCINRPGEIWTEGAGGWQRHDAPWANNSYCEQLVKLIASWNGKTCDDRSPYLSATLPTKERVQIVVPPACEKGTYSFTFRKPSQQDFSLDELESYGTFSDFQEIKREITPTEIKLLELLSNKKLKEFLQLAVLSKKNIIVAGDTGSGKTTLTKSLTKCIPSVERLITIEDVEELTLANHPNKVHLFYTRKDEDEGQNAQARKDTAKSALVSCLRMKPDRILLAELRGDEAWEYIKAVGTGHPGSITTMHAGGALATFGQLVNLVKSSSTGAHLDAEYLKWFLQTNIDVVVFIHKRKIREIYYDPEHKLDLLA